MSDGMRKRALDLYKPPFRFDGITYIWDSDGNMVVDSQATNEDVGEAAAALGPRLRGWGRMKYLPDAEALFVETGHAIAEALTIGWKQLRARTTKEPRHAK